MAGLMKSFAEWVADATGLREYARQQNNYYESVVTNYLNQNGKSADLKGARRCEAGGAEKRLTWRKHTRVLRHR